MSFDSRDLSSAGELKALAHPLRLAIVEQLGLHGPMTASELGDALDETPANCSWHLRKLGEYGIVEETHEGQGRRRPWRTTAVAHSWREPDRDPVAREAGRALTDAMVDREVARFRHNQAVRDDDGDTLGATSTALWMTDDEEREWYADLMDLAMRYQDRLERRERPADAHLVHTLFLTSRPPDRESAATQPEAR